MYNCKSFFCTRCGNTNHVYFSLVDDVCDWCIDDLYEDYQEMMNE